FHGSIIAVELTANKCSPSINCPPLIPALHFVQDGDFPAGELKLAQNWANKILKGERMKKLGSESRNTGHRQHRNRPADKDPALMRRAQVIDKAALSLGYAGVYSSFLLHTFRSAEKFGLDPRDILIELGRRKVVGGQEDMVVDVALALSKAKAYGLW
ncbi:MAG: hypothetical protein ACOY9Y_11325, partial [Bacillota bacterium]